MCVLLHVLSAARTHLQLLQLLLLLLSAHHQAAEMIC